MKEQAPAQAGLKDRKLTLWQENFAKYIFQETGYVPELETLKLAMLLQKAYRQSPWNKARLNKADKPEPLPDLPIFTGGEMETMRLTEQGIPAVNSPVPVPVNRLEAMRLESLKAELGPAWEYRAAEPFTTIFTPEPGPDPEVVAKVESKIGKARNKAGRKATT